MKTKTERAHAKGRALQRGEFAKDVYDALEARLRAEQPRDYIGASIIAHPCDRLLFYVTERVVPNPPTARGVRIYEFGDAIERLVVRWLRDCMFHVYDIDPSTNDQFKVKSANLQGHLDAIVSRASLLPSLFDITLPEFYCLEAKSHRARYYEEIVENGVMIANFEHYAQLQTYLHHSRSIARRAFCIDASATGGLYVAVNKDTSEVYLEEVAYDADVANQGEQRAQRIKGTRAPPPRMAPRADLQPCKWCDYATHCFNDHRAVVVPQRVGNANRVRQSRPTTVSERAILRNPEWGV